MHRKLTFSLVLGTATLAACSQDTPSAPSDLITPSFAIQASPQLGDLIPDQYIVVFKDNISDSPGHARRLAAIHGATVRHAYGRALKGFAGRMSAAAAGRFRGDPTVAYVEQDQVMTADETQSGATWGLDRIDQADTPLSTTYNYISMGAGVTAYIIDTGILIGHNEFGGRASSGFDAVDGGDADDCNGHGTHVAGTVGGTMYGVAKGVNLVAVRVLNCSGSGSNSGVIAGINWVTSDHQPGAPAVANMSLGGGFSSALNAAVTASIADGVTYAVAAGNSNANACNYSPSSTATALTVGATTSTDAEASYSNTGTCVDVLAPGSSITSAWISNSTATNTISGTSMASPHVAGAAARYLSTNPGASTGVVASFLLGQATLNTITLKTSGRGKKGGATGTPNKMLFMGSGQ